MKLRHVTTYCLVFLFLVIPSAWARHEALTGQQKQQLEHIDRILLEIPALTNHAQADPAPFRDLVSKKQGKLWDAVNYSLKQVDGFDQIN